jgi:flagellar protein FliO/FliZ
MLSGISIDGTKRMITVFTFMNRFIILIISIFMFGNIAWAQVEHTAPQSTDSQTTQNRVEPAGETEPKDAVDTYLPEFFSEKPEQASDTFQSKFLNMLFLLGLLIAFMILASWALKRLMKTKISQLNTSSSIKVLETRYLSPRATLYLVDVQGQQLLIAESPTSVSCLASLTDEPHLEKFS